MCLTALSKHCLSSGRLGDMIVCVCMYSCVYVQGVSICLYMCIHVHVYIYTYTYVQGAGLYWNSPGGTASAVWLSLTLLGVVDLSAYPKTSGEMSCISMIVTCRVLRSVSHTGYSAHSVCDAHFPSK